MREKVRVVLLAIVFLSFSLSLVAQVKEMKPVEPVNWRELMPFLIDIPRYQSEEKPEGSSVSMANFKVSQVSRDYTSGEKTLKIEIIDGGYVQMEGQNFENTEELKKIANLLDLAKLSSLVK